MASNQPTVPFSRTRTGCFTCREDGYKCDEQKPHCGRCIRLQKTCKGYGVKLKWRSVDGPLPTQSGTGSRGNRRRTSKSKPLAKSSDDGLTITTTTTNTAASSRSQTLQQQSPWAPPAPAPVTMIARNPSYLSPDIGRPDQYLLDHWTTTLAAVVSMAAGAPGTRNPFLVHLTPMMLYSPALRAAICSMSASHLAILRSADPYQAQTQALQTAAIHHRVLAVSALRRALQTPDDPNPNPEPALATILLLQVADRLFAIDTRADHLGGAKAVISGSDRGRGGRHHAWDTASAVFLLSLCFYHDVLASVSRGSRPLLGFDDDGDDVNKKNVNGDGSNKMSRRHFPVIDSMAMEGVASMQGLTTVLRLVGRISRMRDLNFDEQTAAGHAVEEALNALGGGGSDPDSNSDADTNADADMDIHHTVQAYKHAAFIYLYRVWCNVGAPHPLTLRHAAQCLDHLGRVRLSSPLLSAHVWPLWTAGCETTDSAQRWFVGERVDAMYEVRHLPSLRRIRMDIEEVWSIKDRQRADTGVDNVDCIKAILRSRRREADLA